MDKMMRVKHDNFRLGRNQSLRVVCLTSDVGNYLIPGFMHQWRKYTNDLPITVCGYTKPDGFDGDFFKIGDFADYPVNRWSDGLIAVLDAVPEKLVLLMLEDYWLVRDVDVDIIRTCMVAMSLYPNEVCRCDLTTDRLHGNFDAWDIVSINSTDFFLSDSREDYNFSYQASIWRKDMLRHLAFPGETPWESELRGTTRLNSKYRVIGTRQNPMKYQIVVNKGVLDKAGAWMRPPKTLCRDDWKELEEKYGY